MATKKQKKGKTTMALTDFLATESKLVTVRATNWSEIVDNEEAETKPIVVDIGVLPTAPRGAVDIDYSTVQNNPPFVAHVANLSFEIDDEGLRRIFGDLNPKTARVIRDGTRSRGIGLVEFDTREALIEGLKRTDKEVYGRKIRVNVSDKTDSHQSENSRGTFGNNRSNRSGGGGGEERPEMADRWKRAEPRSDDTSDDRPSSGMNRDRPNRSDYGRSNNSRDNQHGNDYGFGYPRSKDDRGGTGGGGGGNGGGRDGGGRDGGGRDGGGRDGGGRDGGGRDYNRQGQRTRYQDDDNRSNSGVDRPRYGGRYSDTRDTRDRNRPNDEPRDDQREPPRERQRLQLQPRTKVLEESQPLSGSSSSINNVAANAAQSSISNPDESLSSITNTSYQQTHDSSINENQDEYQHQDSRESNDNTSHVSTSDEQSTVKPSRGAGASIFGGAKPVDTAARELEIEKKLKELQVTVNERSAGDDEEKAPPTRPSYNRGGGERDVYRAKRTSNNDDHRDRRDDGRSGQQGGDFSNKRENSDARQFDDDNRRRSDDDHYRRGGGGNDRDRHGGPSRRDHESGRTGKYNHHNHPERDNEHGNNRQRDRDDRNQDSNEFSHQGRPSNNNFNSESQPRNQQRGMARRPIKVEDDSNRVQVSNKFAMLDDADLDDDNENDNAQSPSIDE